jgi:hypothetical protein
MKLLFGFSKAINSSDADLKKLFNTTARSFTSNLGKINETLTERACFTLCPTSMNELLRCASSRYRSSHLEESDENGWLGEGLLHARLLCSRHQKIARN